MPTELGGSRIEKNWFRCNVGDLTVHAKIAPYAKWLLSVLRPANYRDRLAERIYEAPMFGHTAAALYLQPHGISRTKLNIVKSVIDTYTARITKRRPMPSFSITDSLWSKKLRAKKTRKWLVGKMTDTDFDDLSPLACKDAAIGRIGVTAIFAGTDDVVAERVYANELLVDPCEAQYSRPSQVARVRRVARDVLIDKYPEFKSQIAIAPSSNRQSWESGSDEETRVVDMSDYVDVYEAWKLPSGSSNDEDDDDEDEGDLGSDGRYAMVLDTVTLCCEQWDSPRFPFAVNRYDNAVRGWWGRGLLHGGLAEIQGEINNIVRDICQNLAVAGKLIVLQQEQFASPVEMLTGVKPFLIKYKGLRPPEFHVPEPVSSGQVEMLKMFQQQAYDLAGISQAGATSRSSLGLNASGVALDTQYDIESERFSRQEAGYAKYRLTAARCYLDAAKRIAKRKAGEKGKRKSRVLVSRYERGGRIEQLDFADVQLDDADYSLRLESVNFIPDTRAGRISAIQELTKAGLIPQWMAGPLLGDEPDLAHANRILYADFDNLERIMEMLGDPSINIATIMPEPDHNLDMAKVMVRAYYNAVQAEIKTDDPDYEVVLQRYRDWRDELIVLIQKRDGQQQSAPPPGAPGMGPGEPPPPGMQGLPPGAGGPGLPPGMAPPNGVMPPGVIPPPMAA